MEDKILKKIYVGIDVNKSDSLLISQTQICRKFNLFQREELHITIAYFEEITETNLIKLGNSLKSLLNEDLQKVEITGVGGVIKVNHNKFIMIDTMEFENTHDFPRVLWFTVHPTDALINFRNSLISIAMTVNLSIKYLRPTFYPHLTIGSGGNTDKVEKWKRWDTQAIEKNASMNDYHYHKMESFSKVHITDSSIHPESLFSISN
jgi:2'-5' RNA ligase